MMNELTDDAPAEGTEYYSVESAEGVRNRRRINRTMAELLAENAALRKERDELLEKTKRRPGNWDSIYD